MRTLTVYIVPSIWHNLHIYMYLKMVMELLLSYSENKNHKILGSEKLG